ncbi:sulfotransferase [Coleofasciculus chthonoplastes]|uniref:sulfotransferase n=1 Tax=Coleofasciculus chthonoplastes TaxID=64178 RepID=UPI0032F9289C
MTFPNFLVIGAAKAGTTALYRFLEQHPQIYMSPVKEPYFFALDGQAVENFQGPGVEKIKRYATLNAYLSLFENVSTEIAIGEASTWYLYQPQAAERINYYIPNVKLIAILRDPVERAYSQFTYMIAENREFIEDFAQALVAEKERIHQNWLPWWHYKQRGFYYRQIKRYFDIFDPDHIKVYLYEDLNNDPNVVMKDIFFFLQVDDNFIPDVSKQHNVTYIPKNKTLSQVLDPRNSTSTFLRKFVSPELRKSVKSRLLNLNRRPKPPLLPEVRKQLIEEYREDILKLQELLDKDLTSWLTV